MASFRRCIRQPALQLLEEDPEIYQRMDHWVEAADWIVWQLTGRYVRNACTAGYKGIYQDGTYPTPAFLGELNPDVSNKGYRANISYIDQNADGTVGWAIGYAQMVSPTAEERWQAWGYPTLTLLAALATVPLLTVAIRGGD